MQANMKIPDGGTKRTDSLDRYIYQGKVLAERNSISWDICLDANGVALPNYQWDLRLLSGDGNPTGSKLRNFCTIPRVAQEMRIRALAHTPENKSNRVAISSDWQNLIKSYVLQQILISGRSLSHINATCGIMRLIATVTNSKSPRLLLADDIDLCVSVALTLQKSGQSAILIRSFVKTVLDANHIPEAAPLTSLRNTKDPRRPEKIHQAKFVKQPSDVRDTLSSRKSEQKLPEKRAFWELMRIIFTEKPKSFVDAIRFAQCKLLTLSGLRIGEIAFLPVDWKRTQNYYDRTGRSAGDFGGISQAILLRYFANP